MEFLPRFGSCFVEKKFGKVTNKRRILLYRWTTRNRFFAARDGFKEKKERPGCKGRECKGSGAGAMKEDERRSDSGGKGTKKKKKMGEERTVIPGEKSV